MIAQAGLQVGNGELIGPLLQSLKDFGYTIIRLDVQRVSLEQATLCAQEVIDYGMQPLCIIRSHDLMYLPLGTLYALGNEPNFEHEGWTAQSYIAAAAECVNVAERDGLRLYLGEVGNLNADGFAFLSKLPWDTYPSTICCSVHRYPERNLPQVPHRGWPSREAEVATLKAIVGSRPLACTEVGYHNAEGGSTEEQTAERMMWERGFFSGQGFEIVSAYNINDGDSSEPIDHYGFRRLDGSWKPVAAAFAQKEMMRQI